MVTTALMGTVEVKYNFLWITIITTIRYHICVTLLILVLGTSITNSLAIPLISLYILSPVTILNQSSWVVECKENNLCLGNTCL